VFWVLLSSLILATLLLKPAEIMSGLSLFCKALYYYSKRGGMKAAFHKAVSAIFDVFL
jgi:hypothetical protein